MKIIKLNAIDSTNSFLKDLVANTSVENFTVVVAESQTKGRGQQEGNWLSEPYKNLTFSVFIKDLNINITNQKYLSFAISLSIYQALYDKKINGLSIKWPNDIMAVNKKLCGILIENNLQKNQIRSSIIGIGLNVNQTYFSEAIPKATSMHLETKEIFDLDILLNQILKKIKINLEVLTSNNFELVEESYLAKLYKRNKIATFRSTINNELFNGIIIGISKNGNLQIQLENDKIKEFGIKEVSFA